MNKMYEYVGLFIHSQPQVHFFWPSGVGRDQLPLWNHHNGTSKMVTNFSRKSMGKLGTTHFETQPGMLKL